MVVEGPTPGIGDFAINDAYSLSCGQCYACRQVFSGQAQELRAAKSLRPDLAGEATSRLLAS